MLAHLLASLEPLNLDPVVVVTGEDMEAVAEAVARGELDDHVDVLHLLELAIGACLAASLIRGPEALDDGWVEATTRLIVEGVRRR